MTITIRELLNHFNLEIDLPEYLYSEYFSGIFKEADLEIVGDIYKFKKDETVLTISPNEEELVTLKNISGPCKSRRVYTKDQICLY